MTRAFLIDVLSLVALILVIAGAILVWMEIEERIASGYVEMLAPWGHVGEAK